MRYLWLIAYREFAENLKTKGFWIGILMFPILLIAAGTLPMLMAKKGQPTRHYVILDQTGEFETIIRQAMRHENAETAVPAGSPDASRNRFVQVALPDDVPLDDLALAEPILREYLRGNRTLPDTPESAPLFAAIVIPANFGSVTHSAWRYWSDNPADVDLRNRVDKALTGELRRREFVRLGIDPALIALVQGTSAEAQSMDPKKETGKEKVNLSDQVRRWIPSVFVYILWVAIFSISQMLLNSVIEEKSNRVIEVLLSSVTPGELMLGKLAGIAAVGLVMLGTWMASMTAMVVYQVSRPPVIEVVETPEIEPSPSRTTSASDSDSVPNPEAIASIAGTNNLAGTNQDLVAIVADLQNELATRSTLHPRKAPSPPQPITISKPRSPVADAVLDVMTSTWLIPAFIVYFCLGYVLYAALFLTIGSLCNTIKEAQGYFGPVVLILIVPLLLMPFIPRDPNGTLATTLSWIPVYTPFIMMNRITADPPLFDLIGTTAVLIVFNGFILWGCGRIFRQSILRTGQPPRLLELWRWLRQPRGE